MIEKPKRPKKIPNQDNKQPQTIQELIRRYDLDNIDIYKFLDYLVENINNKPNTGEGSTTGDTLPIGAVLEWDSDTIPENWLLLNGQAVSRTTYSELFALYGTRYGAGDGSTTFNLPNRKTRVSVGKDSTDSDFNTLGKTGGEKTHTLTVGEMPKHHHTQDVYALPEGAHDASTAKIVYKDGTTTGWVASGMNWIHDTGEDKPHNNLQPYFVTNFIVKAKQSSGVVATVVDNLSSTSATDALSAKQGKVLNEKIDKNSLYSTHEQVIGTWINGKPIYRKVIELGSVGKATQKLINVGDLNISLVIKQYGMAQMDGADYHWAVSADCFVYNSNSSSISYYNATDATRNVYIILEYTKTTD